MVSRVESRYGTGIDTSGSSIQSDILSAGKMIVLAPALRAATVFSRSPPILKTLPVTVNSPVIAIVGSSGLSSAKDNNEVAIVMPADGPNFVSRLIFRGLSNTCRLSERHPRGSVSVTERARRIYLGGTVWPLRIWRRSMLLR